MSDHQDPNRRAVIVMLMIPLSLIAIVVYAFISNN